MTPLPVAWPNEARAMRDRGMFPHEIGLVLGIPERTVRWGLNENEEHEVQQQKVLRRIMMNTLKDTRGLRLP